jgi:Flp pilus assembly protein TadG
MTGRWRRVAARRSAARSDRVGCSDRNSGSDRNGGSDGNGRADRGGGSGRGGSLDRHAARADSGSAALELVVLAPVLLALLALVIAAGRTSIAKASVDAAARDAARQASIAMNPYAAQTAGQASARAALHGDGLDCSPLVINIDVSDFTTTRAGQPGTVSATVKCNVPLADLYLPGLPGTEMMTFTFVSPLDVYRSR